MTPLALGEVDWLIFVCMLVCSLLIQIGTNVINDALDSKNGIDTCERIGPARMTASGYLTFRQVYTAGMIIFALAALAGIPLVLKGGWPIAIVMIASILSGYLYTGGPKPLSYLGLGDLFVFLFFGLVATASTYYLQMGTLKGPIFIAATQIGMLAMAIMGINNLRDHSTDAKAGKRTIPVRFGVRNAKFALATLILAPFLLNLLWYQAGNILVASLPLLSLPLGLNIIQGVFKYEPSKIYNRFLAETALLELLFGILLCLGWIFS
jgi:1,4-dihydroxy-2-naphthoate octaprenyltransferase